ncbi:MAG: thioredoxin family protein [Gammaproteobacteria bacterium]
MHWLIYLVVGLVALLAWTQFMAYRRAKQTEGRAAPDTAGIDGEAHGEPRRVYYFFAAQCGPCRAITPLVDRLRVTHRNLVKVDVAEAPEIARGFGIAATPSFVVVENGTIRTVRLGGQSETQLLDLLRAE